MKKKAIFKFDFFKNYAILKNTFYKTKEVIMAKAKACCAASAKRSTAKRRVVFKLNAEAGKTVSIAGSFNDWDPEAKYLKDKNNTGEYVGILMLAPGVYEYKFVIDGVWHLDENNSNFSPNDFGTLNSVIEVEQVPEIKKLKLQFAV